MTIYSFNSCICILDLAAFHHGASIVRLGALRPVICIERVGLAEALATVNGFLRLRESLSLIHI